MVGFIVVADAVIIAYAVVVAADALVVVVAHAAVVVAVIVVAHAKVVDAHAKVVDAHAKVVVAQAVPVSSVLRPVVVSALLAVSYDALRPAADEVFEAQVLFVGSVLPTVPVSPSLPSFSVPPIVFPLFLSVL